MRVSGTGGRARRAEALCVGVHHGRKALQLDGNREWPRSARSSPPCDGHAGLEQGDRLGAESGVGSYQLW
jgi:hypothetical protein